MSDRSLRGMRLGAQSMETESGVEPAPRQRVEYRCEDGEQVFVTFSSEAEIPPVWVSKTGKEACWLTANAPSPATKRQSARTGTCCWSAARFPSLSRSSKTA